MIPKIFILLIATNIFAQSPDFFRERIEIGIHHNACDVTGTYYLKNSSEQDMMRMFYYPVVVNDQIDFPDSVRVTKRISGDKIKYIVSERGVSFTLNIPAKSIIVIDVYYHQKISGNAFEYILLTTKNWHKPLDFAEYQITIPADMKITQISYPFKKAFLKNGRSVYTLEKKDFEPDKNIIIRWEG